MLLGPVPPSIACTALFMGEIHPLPLSIEVCEKIRPNHF